MNMLVHTHVTSEFLSSYILHVIIFSSLQVKISWYIMLKICNKTHTHTHTHREGPRFRKFLPAIASQERPFN